MNFIKNKNGFTIIEMLLSLFVTSFSILLLVQVIHLISKLKLNDERCEDLIAIEQLRLRFLEFEEIEFDEQELSFIYHDKDCQLVIDRGKVFKNIGHEIFFQKIKDGYFEEKNNCIYLNIEREKEKRYLLGCIE
ncbi:MAG: prepilin-type N-terminal cleavage/methylation domain-containing protein [Erysipelotrichaceae bacterium]